jgi:hypothetical protein
MRAVRIGQLGAVAALLLCGCWQTPVTVAQFGPAVVTVRPEAATVTVGRGVAFTARVEGADPKGLAWSVAEPGGGRVDGPGAYFAPMTPGTYTVRAAVGNGAGSARVTVVAKPAGEIHAPGRVQAGAEGVTARIDPVAGSSYAWAIQGGRITAGADAPAVTFQAGPGPRLTLACRVTNAAGDALNTSLDIPVSAPVALAITPKTAILTAGRTMKFGYTVDGGATLAVYWSLGEPGCGSLDDGGRYTAPEVPGQYTVRVISRDEPGKYAVAKVKVVARPPEGLSMPESFTPGTSGLRAEVPEVPGMTYAWSIEGGAIAGASDGPKVTFQAGAGPVLTLRCKVTNEAGDSYTAAKQIPAKP